MSLFYIRLCTFCLFLAALVAAPGALRAQQPAGDAVLLDRIVALVDDGMVLKSELDAQVEIITRQLLDQGVRLPPPEVLRGQILETLVVQQVQLQRAERLGVRIGDDQVNLSLQRVAERNGIPFSRLPEVLAQDGINYFLFREQMRREMTIDALRQRDVMPRIAVSEREIARWLEQHEATRGSQAEYDISQILMPLPEDPSPQQLAVAQQRALAVHAMLVEGADFAGLAVAESSDQQALTGGRLGWRLGAQLPPQFAGVIMVLRPGEFSEPVRSSSGFHIFLVNDVRGGSENVVQLQTRTRHILMTPNEVLDEDTVRGRLATIRERVLEQGQSFADIAMLESEDPGSAARGGDLGWNPPGTFVPEFETVLAQLEPGELSEPFRSPFGWHIILLEDRKERDTTDEVRRMQAMQAIRTGKLEQETELWLRRLRDEAWVEIRG
jgi:peptidyl-prolyl cis-trans isomerase SurA